MARCARILAAVVFLGALRGAAHAGKDDGAAPGASRGRRGGDVATSVETAADESHPRLKASYRIFSIASLEPTAVWLRGGQLDAYAISERGLRLGLELEGGGGDASLLGSSASLGYGLAGLTLGLQLPGRVTPFVEGRLAGGFLTGTLDGTLALGNVTLTGRSATTWIYAGGLEAGVEIYLHSRVYLSLAVGWVRTSWHGVDIGATIAQPPPTTNVVHEEIVGDSVTIKIGLGL